MENVIRETADARAPALFHQITESCAEAENVTVPGTSGIDQQSIQQVANWHGVVFA